MSKKNLLLSILLVSLTACSMVPGNKEAKSLLEQKKYVEAIGVLEANNNIFNKKLLERSYIEYGVSLLKSVEKSKGKYYNPKVYTLAREQFKKAMELNPKSEEAQGLYLLVGKLQLRNMKT